MDERLRFVARLLEGEKMAVLCREFDISRKTGYKIFSRYKDLRAGGADGSLPATLSAGLSAAVSDREADPAAEVGAPQLGRSEDPREAPPPLHLRSSLPAISTVHAVLDRHGLVTPTAAGTLQSPGNRALAPAAPERSLVRRLQGRVHARRPALLLSADHHRCGQPLSDLLRGTRGTTRSYAFTVFERVFKDFGLPLAIRTDNGVPFASRRTLFGLCKLSVWWLRLGIGIERIKPGTPGAERPSRAHASDA